MNFIEKIKEWIASKVDAETFQVVGSFGLIVFYIGLAIAKRQPDPDLGAIWIWIFLGIPVGLTELTVIWVHDTTITKWVRNLAGKKTDTIVMLSLIGATWYLAGPFAAGYFFTGFLDSHFGEKQYDKS